MELNDPRLVRLRDLSANVHESLVRLDRSIEQLAYIADRYTEATIDQAVFDIESRLNAMQVLAITSLLTVKVERKGQDNG